MSFELMVLGRLENISELMAPGWRGPICLWIEQEVQEVTGCGGWLPIGFGYFGQEGGQMVTRQIICEMIVPGVDVLWS